MYVNACFADAQLLICPLFAAMPPEQQMKVFGPTPLAHRKIVLATNIAETSVTINGIKYVVDSGVVKIRGYNSRIGIEALVVVPTSKASARQRSGRAGRETSGKCFRLYPESVFDELESQTVPEIQRTSLANAILQLKAIGIDDVLGFDYMDAPSVMALKRGLELLLSLQALDASGALGELGKKMSQLPLEPRYSKAVIASGGQFKCSEEVITIVSMLSVESIFFVPSHKRKQADAAKSQFGRADGDHLMMLNVFRAYSMHKDNKERKVWCQHNFVNWKAMHKVEQVRQQIQEYARMLGIPLVSCGSDYDQVKQCFVSAFFMNVAFLQADKTYRTFFGQREVSIHPSSVAFSNKPQCIIYDEIIQTSRSYLRSVLPIDPEWLFVHAPKVFERVKRN
jgi:HrpA-like RNA helicase